MHPPYLPAFSHSSRGSAGQRGVFSVQFVSVVCCRPHLTAVGAVRGAEVADSFDIEPFSQF